MAKKIPFAHFSFFSSLFFFFFFFLAASHSLWDLSSLTRDQTCALAEKELSPNHWAARKFLPFTHFSI